MTVEPIVVDSLLDGAPCGFVAFTDDGIVHAANRTLLQMLGYDAGEVVGRHIESLLAVGSRIFYQTHWFPLLRLHDHAEEVFLLLKAKDGSDVAALVNASRQPRDGEHLTSCVLMRVVERRKFEDALVAARKAADEARAVADARGNDLQLANELLERQAVELELSQQQLLEHTAELEVSEQQLVEQAVELERQRAIAEEANRAKSAFLANMSHELRTPLNAIGGYAQLLELGVHGAVNDAQLDALARINRSQKHLLRLINDVLNLARIEAGRVDYTLEHMAVADVMRTTMPMVEPQLASKKLSHTMHVPPELTVYADREKVEQILLNLLSNASKFTESGGRVNISATSGDDGLVRISVADTGVGIPADRITSVFEPFVQLDEGKRRRADGIGLGLAISRDLARGMSGDLTVTSEVAVGSTFTLTLPSAPISV